MAENGNVKAQMDLATIYRKGLGIEVDMAAVAYWYSKAAMLGNQSAQEWALRKTLPLPPSGLKKQPIRVGGNERNQGRCGCAGL